MAQFSLESYTLNFNAVYDPINQTSGQSILLNLSGNRGERLAMYFQDPADRKVVENSPNDFTVYVPLSSFPAIHDSLNKLISNRSITVSMTTNPNGSVAVAFGGSAFP